MMNRSPLSALFRALASLALAVFFGVAPGPAVASPLEGAFYGIDAAEGGQLSVAVEGALASGTLTDPAGISRPFELTIQDGGAEGVMALGVDQSLLRLDPQPFGALVTLIPIDEAGAQQLGEAQIFTFVRRDLELPPLPTGFVSPPTPGTRSFGASSFLISYAFWPPDGVRSGYLALAPRHRTIIALFPSVQLDVIWKLCLAPQADRALGIALAGQGVNCDEVRRVIAGTQAVGTFDRFKEAVAGEATVLQQAVRCADNYVETKETCDAAAAAVSRQAVSLETAATVLKRFR
ncbi:MAG: hypothetical protein AAFP23_11450 [Pseudomonadota bacterium]